MDYLLTVVALVVVTSWGVAIHLFTSRAKKPCPTNNLPPGSMGVPVMGQTLSLLRAIRGNFVERWVQDRIDRYGPVSKLSLFGTPTAILAGPAANKFMFFSSSLPLRQPWSVQRIIGAKNILNLHGDDHRRIRGALLEFLKPDMIKLYVGRVDADVRQHLEENWAGRTTVTVLPLMKRLTFDIMSGLLFGHATGAVADELGQMLEGMMAIPVNLPFTAYGRSLKASRRARRLLEGVMREKKAKLGDDLISRLLDMTDGDGQQLLTNEEILHNSMAALIAGHDTTSLLITFMVRHLANDPATLAAMVQGIDRDGEALSWEDLSKMKFTWRVAQEILRIVPPVFGNFRTSLEDVQFGGYLIPKG